MYSLGPVAAALGGAHTLLTTLIDLLAPSLGSVAAAAAIAALTVGARLLLLPLSYLQVRGEHHRARLAPHLAELRRRYAHDPERLLARTQTLYAQERVSPFAGCLPGLVQAPVFFVCYGLFITPRIDGAANELLAHSLGGVPLGSTLPQAVAAGTPGPVLVFVALLALLAAVAAATRRWLTLPTLASATPAALGAGALSWLPWLVVPVAAVAPLAAGVYLVSTTSWTLAERLVLRRVTASG